jgi:hypothetical protein
MVFLLLHEFRQRNRLDEGIGSQSRQEGGADGRCLPFSMHGIGLITRPGGAGTRLHQLVTHPLREAIDSWLPGCPDR